MHVYMDFDYRGVVYVCTLGVFLVNVVSGVTNPNDFKILNDFRNGLENPELLKWPSKGNDPCGPPAWPHVFCSSDRVTQIQVQGLGLKGPLPQNLNELEKLQNLGLQKNGFNGKLPTFSGLSDLKYVYLDDNQFDMIPANFFDGLSNVQVLALDENPFNMSGWSIPTALQDSAQLANFSCMSCNIVGPVPDFFGKLPSLTALKLSYNRLTGKIPDSFRDSMLQILWLNNQNSPGMTGPIELIGTMDQLMWLWLQGNSFSGPIPDTIGGLTSLNNLNLNGNQLVGLIPQGLANLKLSVLDLNNNKLMGPIPKFRAANATYSSNSFCQPTPGVPCGPQVNALLDLLGVWNYPANLASEWSGNDPCTDPWLGISCNPKGQVTIVNLQNKNLTGKLSPSLANLDSLLEVHLKGNSLHGPVPANLTKLRFLRLLDLSGNNFDPPLPKFRDGVTVITDGNAHLVANVTVGAPPPSIGPFPPLSHSPKPSKELPLQSPSPSDNQPTLSDTPPSPEKSSSSGLKTTPSAKEKTTSENHEKTVIIIVVSAVSVVLALLAVFLFFKSRRKREKDSITTVIHPKDPFDQDNIVKITVLEDPRMYTAKSDATTTSSGGKEGSRVIEIGNLVISTQDLRRVTNNFASENELGRGGFGVVYKGVIEDGIQIAVKRMESAVINSKALDEFEAEIAVLSRVRHRHLVSLLGYSIEGNERLLVYEYMPKGALSRHLFRWKILNLEPLSWTKRLNIALDVARGMEYLHNLAHQSFIHRDLKSSNILLDDDFRAKVSDFGLVKLAPDKERSVATRLAGTFGYLAPEYAVTGKVTTKIDVFSFGVVLMELVTGLTALDEHRSEETRYLVEWFWQIKSNKENLIASVDPALDAKKDIHKSIFVIAELAGHCTARDPNHRPDMSHAVNVLGQLVEIWKPVEESDEYSGIDYSLPLPEMLKDWQDEDTGDFTGTSQDSRGSIPAKPTGFADSFTSNDAR
ncbi:receptor-like kinase TMK3 [Lycium barbarum]|uniref:receptor-like kinase TMK3 n=1 Tax=Lycium barbarum TaxID=112863 RepID=UPI00293EABE0|nr:receptor-like kinase TMK3 [Lycium barbarum]